MDPDPTKPIAEIVLGILLVILLMAILHYLT